MLERFLPQNQAPMERAIRILAGLGLLTLTFMGPHTPWGLLGLVLIATGALGRCPIYALLRISTKSSKRMLAE